MNRLQVIENRLAPLKNAMRTHRIYAEIDRIDALRLFMEHHVFAVWDFMSLLKALQRRLCCVELPWAPATDSQASRFINEIVLAEESDEDGRGGFASHFDLYHRAMDACGADTTAIDSFLNAIRSGQQVSAALSMRAVPEAAQSFVATTFDIIESGDLCEIAAAFTFGREDLLPDVFQRIVDELNTETDGSLNDFKFYLQRHIGLDGDEHGPMATRLLQSLCGDNESRWQVAEQAALACLKSRHKLWDGIYEAIGRRSVSAS